MKQKLYFLVLLWFNIGLYGQVQISNFTYNSVQNSNPTKLQRFNNQILFSAVNDGSGRELWSSVGAQSSTNLVFDIEPGENNGLNDFLSTTLNNDFYFTAKNDFSFSGGEIWKMSGTNSAVSLVTTFNGRIFGLTTVGNYFFMTIKTNDNTLQIWKSDGTDLGTVIVKDNIPIWNTPTFQGSVNNTLIFTIQIPSTSTSNIWRSDGTDAGTYPLTSGLDGNGSGQSGTSSFSQYINYNNKLFFVTRLSLYETDGTIAGTNEIGNVWNAQANLVDFSDALELNGYMYFSFFSKSQRKLSIYKSNGTSSDTSEIYNITGNQYFYPSYLKQYNDKLIFTSINSNNGTSLFYLDSNTSIVSEIIEINASPIEPVVFVQNFTTLSLDNIIGGVFFVISPETIGPVSKKGWILDLNSNTINNIGALDNLALVQGVDQRIIFNNELYYSKDFQLWKFDLNSLSTNSFKQNQKFSFYPNPILDVMYFNNPNSINEIKIFNIYGQLISKHKLIDNNFIELEELATGTYFIQVIDYRNESITKKFIKK